MDKKYCENCRFLMKATEYDHYEDQIRFASCSVVTEPNLYGDVSMAFDVKRYMKCAIARMATRECGPDAKLYEEAL